MRGMGVCFSRRVFAFAAPGSERMAPGMTTVAVDSVECSLEGYRPSEVRALMEHKYFLGIERGYDPSIEEVIASWEARYASDWRAKKMRHDAEVQVREIQDFQARLASERGQSVTFREAAQQWVEQCECEWRRNWEAGRSSGV
jgi:hypothetical protein